MRAKGACLILLLSAVLSSPCLAINHSLATQRGVLYLPFQYSFQVPAEGVRDYLDGEGYPTVIYRNEYDDDYPEDCWVETFDGLLSNSATPAGLFLIDTHGDLDDGSIIVEAYKNFDAMIGAYNALQGYVKYEDHPDTWEVCTSSDSVHTFYGIAVSPRMTAAPARRVGIANGLVINTGCGVLSFMDEAWPSARCRIGHADDLPHGADAVSLIARMCGGEGKENRSVAMALHNPTGLPLYSAAGSDECTILAPVVLSVVPVDGSYLENSTETMTVTFNAAMNQEICPAMALQGTGKICITGQRWISENRLEVTIWPETFGSCQVSIDPACASVEGIPLDGNTNPPGEDGLTPAGDSFDVDYVSDYPQPPCPNPAALFGGFWAFRDPDGTHVLWVTDPERGSTTFEIWGGSAREQLLGIVPAAGGTRPHYYEETIQSDASVFEVVEKDADPATPDDGTRPFGLSPSPPPDLTDLRRLNEVVAQWPATEITPIRDYAGVDRDHTATDFVFYTGRADFLPAIFTIRDRLAQDGWTSRWAGGTSDPNQARTTFRGAYEDAVAQHYWHLPLCVIVGEANQGDHPERNVVGTFYVPDDDDQCYWEPCASDLEMTNFYGNGPECPYTRIVASNVSELDNCVASTLEYYDGVNAHSPRVVALAGDLNAYCNVVDPPRELVDDVRAWYSDHGIPIGQRNESSYSCYDYAVRQAVFCGDVNAGVTEIIGTGRTTNRSLLPGYFCQKLGSPSFVMQNLTTRQRIICEFPGCGMADADRNNPYEYPSLAKMYLTYAPDSGTSAVAWLSHSRGGSELFHHALARAYFDERLNGQWHWAIQEVYWSVIQKLWKQQPGMRPFLREAMAFGFPVQFPGFLTPTDIQEQLPDHFDVSLANEPNPGRRTTLRYDLPGLARIHLGIYDVGGRLVQTLVKPDTVYPAGRYTTEWDGRLRSGDRAAGGLYFARLEVDGRIAVARKIILLP